jgi:hypothetical protein
LVLWRCSLAILLAKSQARGCASVGRPVLAGKRNRRLDAPMQMGFYPPVYPPAGRRTEEDR